MDDIINKVKDITDEMEYFIIFNILTEENTVKNFSENSNGVFFVLDKIPRNIIEKLNKKLDDIKKSNLEKKEYEQKLREMVTARQIDTDECNEDITSFMKNNKKLVSNITDETQGNVVLIDNTEMSDYSDCENLEEEFNTTIKYDSDDEEKELFGMSDEE